MIYIDDMRLKAKVRCFTGCFSHLFAVPPDEEELILFGTTIGLMKGWFQKKKFPIDSHWDVTDKYRELAIQYGAESVTASEGARIRIEWKTANPIREVDDVVK